MAKTKVTKIPKPLPCSCGLAVEFEMMPSGYVTACACGQDSYDLPAEYDQAVRAWNRYRKAEDLLDGLCCIEHKRLAAVRVESKTITGFLEWLLEEKSIVLAVEVPDAVGHRTLSETFEPFERLVAEYYGIDYSRLMAERILQARVSARLATLLRGL